MVIKSEINHYPGINPHVDPARHWKGFHQRHIGHLEDALKEALKPYGYSTKREEGNLQLTTLERYPDQKYGVWGTPHSIEPDIAITKSPHNRPYNNPSSSLPSSATESGVAVMSIAEAFAIDEDEYIDALSIQRLGASNDELPVAWIELLSPSNKPGGSHHPKYWDKRFGLLNAGIPLIEIDYLHHLRSDQTGLPQYPNDPGSHAYKILVYDPKRTEQFAEGSVTSHGFHVADPIPSVFIPFKENEPIHGITFDFGSPYATTFTKYYAEIVDYSVIPGNLSTFSFTDQQQIRARMFTVIEAALKGQDLNTHLFQLACSPAEAEEKLRDIFKQLEPPNRDIDR